MCGSMTDIQSATAEIRRGKKIEDRRNHGKNCQNQFVCVKLVTFLGHPVEVRNGASYTAHFIDS